MDRIGARQLRNSITSGELRPLWRGVVVESRRFLDLQTRAAAGLMVARDGAVLCDVTAAALHGCRAVQAPDVHVLLPYEVRVKGRPGLVVHHGGFFADDVVEIEGLRMLAMDRVVADLLCSARAQDGLALADEVLRMAGGESEIVRKQIGAALRRRQDPRGTVRAAGLLDLASPRAASPAESWFRLRLVELGFPIPAVNWPLTGLDGREVYVLDLAWPELRIVVEYDGYAAHVGREVPDAVRQEDLRRRGWIVVRANCADLQAIERVNRELRAAFARRGYTW